MIKMALLNFIVSLPITAIGYLAVPVFVALRNKDLTESKIRKISIINTLVVCFLFIVIKAALGSEQNGSPFILWGGVGYAILKGKMKKDEKNTTNNIQKAPVPNPSGPSFYRAPSENTFTQHAPKRNNDKIKNVALVILSVLFVMSSGLCLLILIGGYSLQEDYEAQIAQLEEDNEYLEYHCDSLNDNISELRDYKNSTSDKIEFYDSSVVFVIDGYGNYYYTYDQMMNVVPDNASYSFWAYNKEQAIDLGYVPFQQ